MQVKKLLVLCQQCRDVIHSHLTVNESKSDPLEFDTLIKIACLAIGVRG